MEEGSILQSDGKNKVFTIMISCPKGPVIIDDLEKLLGNSCQH